MVKMKRFHKLEYNKHVLYEKAVQNPESDANFMRRVFRKVRGRSPLVLREDFCGTAALCCEWVRSDRSARAYGIDNHRPTLDWARSRNVSHLGAMRNRVELIHGDVLDHHPLEADVVAAFNFSYFCFKQRSELLRYCRSVRSSLNEEGIFFLDIYGGPQAQEIQEEETDHGDFTYVWDQAQFNPITGEILCHIHFKGPNGWGIRRAFTYDWRLWSIPELSDVLTEGGFSEVQVYWEGTDEDGDGNGVFRLSRKGDDAEAFIAYVVAIR